MLKLITTCAWISLGIAGIFLAGYLGLFEILIEVALVSWTTFAVWRIPTENAHEAAPGWYATLKAKLRFPEFKERLIKTALDGQSFKAATAVALVGVVTGWVLMLGWLFFRDPLFVLTREIKETVVDLVVFVPFVFLLARWLNGIAAAGRAAATEAESRYSGEEPADDPRDPEYFDVMLQYARAHSQIAKEADAKLGESVTRGSGALLLTILLAVAVLGSYVAGHRVAVHSPIAYLDQVSAWQIAK